jgi:glycerol kinase
MTDEAGLWRCRLLQVDGGASANDLLCQLQADQLGVPVQRPRVLETTALGAAFLAGLGTGVWSSTDELVDTWQLDARFDPTPGVRTTAATRSGCAPSSGPVAGRRAPRGESVGEAPARRRSGRAAPGCAAAAW